MRSLRCSFLNFNKYLKHSCYNNKLSFTNDNFLIQHVKFSSLSNNKIYSSIPYNHNILCINKINYSNDSNNNNSNIDIDIEIDNIKEEQNKAENYILSHDFINATKSYSSCLYSIHNILNNNIQKNSLIMKLITKLKLQSMFGLGLSYFGLSKLEKAKETYEFALNTIENTNEFNLTDYGCYFHQYCELLYKLHNDKSLIVTKTIKQVIKNLSKKDILYYGNNIDLEEELYIIFTQCFAYKYNCSFESLGMYEDSICFQKLLLDFYYSIVGNTIDIAHCFSNIGSLLEKLGQYEEALEYKLTALEINKYIIGDNYENIAVNYNDIGTLYTYLNEYEKSILYLNKSLELYKSQLNKNYISIGVVYYNIGNVLVRLHNYNKALNAYKESLIISEKYTNNLYNKVLISLLNTASELYLFKKYNKALEYCFTLLNIINNNNKDNTDIIEIQTLLVTILIDKRKYKDALQYQLNILEKAEKIYEKNSIKLVQLYDTISFIYKSLKEYNLALDYKYKSLDIIRTKYQIDSEITLTTIVSLCDILKNLQQYYQLLKYYDKIYLFIDKNHKFYGKIHEISGFVHSELGNYTDAKNHQIIALDYYKTKYGNNSIYVANLQHSMGVTYYNLKEYEKSLDYYLSSLDIYINTSSSTNDNKLLILNVYNNITNNYRTTNCHRKAIEYDFKIIELTKSLYGEDNISIGNNYNQIGTSYRDLKEYNNALKYKRKALELYLKEEENNKSIIKTIQSEIKFLKNINK